MNNEEFNILHDSYYNLNFINDYYSNTRCPVCNKFDSKNTFEYCIKCGIEIIGHDKCYEVNPEYMHCDRCEYED